MKAIANLTAFLFLTSGLAFAADSLFELTASKDTFGRSNERNGNSGSAPLLLLAPVPGVTTLIAFDLTKVTNEISSAEFSFRIQENNRTPLSITIATMAHHEKNAEWIDKARPWCDQYAWSSWSTY